MRLGLVVVTLLALALLPAPALAGSEGEPDVPGIEDVDAPALDFQGAWFETTRAGLRFTVKFGGADAPPADHYYAVSFTYLGERHVAVVAFDEDGAMHTDLRPSNFNRQGVRGPETLDGKLEDARFEPGFPAYVSALIPRDELPGYAPGKVIIDLSAGTGFYDRGVRRGWTDVDGRDTQNAYVVQEALLPRVLEQNLGWIAASASLALLAAVAALVLVVRRSRAAAAPPRPVLAPAAEAPSRARTQGDAKFRLDPRK